jgi:ribosomal protein S18 acetylase RimI-like enzyme
MCNMAVDPAYRRRGIAQQLLCALEELARLAGEPNIYLHLRFQDDAAGRLYRGAGYQAVKQDWPLVSWLGQDRRYLMKKRLELL